MLTPRDQHNLSIPCSCSGLECGSVASPGEEKALQKLAVRSVTGAQEPFEHYQKSTGFGAEARVAAALAKWGPNTFVVPLPKFGDMLKEQLLAPFFVFQVFCVGLWCLDDYW